MPPLRLLALGIILRAELLLGAIAATSFFGFFFASFSMAHPQQKGWGWFRLGCRQQSPWPQAHRFDCWAGENLVEVLHTSAAVGQLLERSACCCFSTYVTFSIIYSGSN